MGTIDLTVEMRRRWQHPCDCCGMGFSSIGQYTDIKTGHLMQESHDCTKTCQRLQDHWNKLSSIKPDY